MPGLTTFSKVDVSKIDMTEYEDDDKKGGTAGAAGGMCAEMRQERSRAHAAH